MDGNNIYVLKTEEHTAVELHYVNLSKEDENGWKLFSLLNCNGVNTNYRKIEIKIYPKDVEEKKVKIKEVTVSNINNNVFKSKHNDSFTLVYQGDTIYNLSDISHISIKVIDTEDKIVENWNLEVILSLNLKEKVKKVDYSLIKFIPIIILFIYLIVSKIDTHEIMCLIRK